MEVGNGAEFSSDLSTKLTLKFLLCQEVPHGHSPGESLPANSARNNAAEFANNLNCSGHYELIRAPLAARMLRHLDPAVLTISIAVSFLALFSAREVPFQFAARTSGETIDGAVDKD